MPAALRLGIALFLAGCAAEPAASTGQVKTFLKSELASFNGSNSSSIYMGLLGLVFDVSSGRKFYAVGAPYEALAGRESSRAVALMSLEEADLEGEDDMTGIGEAEREEMTAIFEDTYVRKYPLIGLITDSRAIPPGKVGTAWYREVEWLATQIGPATAGKQEL